MIKYRVILPNGYIEFTTNALAQEYCQNNVIAANVEAVQEPAPIGQNLEEIAAKYISFGSSLFEDLKRKMWVKNSELQSSGNSLSVADMMSLLDQTDMFEKASKGGALDTARNVLMALKQSLPAYTEIADFGIEQIGYFLEAQ